MAIEFTKLSDPQGLELFDDNEQRRLTLRTADSIDPVPSDTGDFRFPVDVARQITTSTLFFDQKYTVTVHNGDGTASVRLNPGDSYELTDSTQFIGLDGPMKLYCRIDQSGSIALGMDAIRLEFDGPVKVDIGARSLHERPAGTITTPDDPRSIMDAITAMGSALKTDTPERSWPTLRGHPPRIERGDSFEARTTGERPETGITFEIPPSYRAVNSIAPVSFYLGANVIPSDSPRLRTEATSYDLGVERSLEDDAARLLKRVFLLDCIVRTEGVYQLDLHERRSLASSLEWNLATVYDEPISVQLDRYLDVPFEKLEPHIPRWPLTAHVPPTPKAVELLPFLVNELGIVREARGTRRTIDPGLDSAAEAETTSRAPLVRSARRSPAGPSANRTPVHTVEPDVTSESIEHAWFGSDVPKNASKATIEGYRNQLERGSRSQAIDILVVCNDARMLEEHDLLDEAYGSRDVLPFDVTSKFGVPTDELATLLRTGGYDFLHYIGHATEAGLQCPDGELDVRSLESVDLGVFFLNACHSYQQGLALARRGAFGGVATVGDIINEHAVESGGVLARLLNFGLPLRGALEIVRDRTILGEQYLIVGDGSTDIAQTDGGPPTVVSLESESTAVHDLRFSHYPTKEYQIGSLTSPNVETISEMYLMPMEDVSTTLSTEEIEQYFSWTKTPVFVDGDLCWNTDVGLPPFLG